MVIFINILKRRLLVFVHLKHCLHSQSDNFTYESDLFQLFHSFQLSNLFNLTLVDITEKTFHLKF